MSTLALEMRPDGAVREQHGHDLVKTADTLADTMTRAGGQWNGLFASYRAPGWQPSPFLTPVPDAVAPPSWVRTGGGVLGVAGAGLAVRGSYSDQYNSDFQAHPEWDDGDRVASAAENAVIVGGATAAGGAGWARGGALAGAAIGSIFADPGTLIGGIVGGVIGGVIGGAPGGCGGGHAGKFFTGKWNGSFG